MIGLRMFLLGLLATSVFTGLATEAVKTVLEEHNKPYYANTLAGAISVVLSGATGAAYVIFTETPFNPQVIIELIGLAVLSWICAMVGYDKVIQAIGQIKTYRKKSDNDE